MKEIKIDLLSALPLASDQTSSPKTSKANKQLPKAVALLLAALFVLTGTAVFSYQRSLDEDSRLNKTLELFGGIGRLVINADRPLQGEHEDRINILIMGIGGEQHEGGELTDTILVASIKPSTKQVAMVSIPRDLLVNIDGYGWRKINNANAFGEMTNPGDGPELARKTVSELLNQPIQYYVKVDFSAFKEIVDTVGGINVIVDNSFTDYEYPTLDKKYQVVSFDAGPQEMDGDTALKYVRSRHSGMNNEGSDFARSKRQQKIIVALRDKMLSANTLLNPKKIGDILDSLQAHIKTNMEVWEVLRIATIAKDVDTKSMTHLVLDDGPGGYLYSGNVGGAYVLQPRGESFKQIQEAFSHLLDTQTVITQAPRLNGRIEQKPNVAVQNGTLIEGFASRSASQLQYNGYTVTSISNAKERNLLKSVIYDLSNGQNQASVEELSKQFNATISQTPYTDIAPENAQILIVLGDPTNR